MNLPKHKFWGAGEPNCPADLKGANGELHTMRCKVCGDGWRKSSDVCFGPATAGEQVPESAPTLDELMAVVRLYGKNPTPTNEFKVRACLRDAIGVPACGACPGDGTICPNTCRLAEESPPIAGVDSVDGSRS